MRRRGSGYYDGWYSVPAGHVEAGESPVDCLIRETKEEIGIDLIKKNITHAHTMYRIQHGEASDRVDCFFTAEWRGKRKPTICELRKCDDMQWFSLSALPKKMIPFVRAAILSIEKDQPYSELTLDYHC